MQVTVGDGAYCRGPGLRERGVPLRAVPLSGEEEFLEYSSSKSPYSLGEGCSVCVERCGAYAPESLGQKAWVQRSQRLEVGSRLSTTLR